MKSFKIHFIIIVILLVVQFFSQEIFGFFYLRYILATAKANPTATIYTNSQEVAKSAYTPKTFEFVVVTRDKGRNTETYYSNKGAKRSVALSSDGLPLFCKTTYFGMLAFLVLPAVGLILILQVNFSRMVRTKQITFSNIFDYPYNNTETILLIYGITLFLSAIIFRFNVE